LKKQKVISVNLDPGVSELPYTPDIDVRDYISLGDIMDKYMLGPNGALIMAADLVATEIENLRKNIEDFDADYVLVDTPGQIELFAFRESGPYIINEITTEQTVILYLFDSTFSLNPQNYISNIFLANAVYTRFNRPMINILAKTDLVSKKNIEKILEWGEESMALEEAVEETDSNIKRLMSRGFMQLFSQLGLIPSLLPVSSKKEEGFIQLHAALMRIFAGGEERI